MVLDCSCCGFIRQKSETCFTNLIQILGRFGGGVTTAGDDAAAILPAAGPLGLELDPVLLLLMSVAGLLTGSLFLSPPSSSSLAETFSR